MSDETFWSAEERMERLKRYPSVLDELQRCVNFEEFRLLLQRVRKPSPLGGRPPWDEVLMFKVLLLKELYGLSDDSLEQMIVDRLSVMRFLGQGMGDAPPDAKTIHLFREQLTQEGLIVPLFKRFDEQLARRGLTAKKGSMVDAQIVESRRFHDREQDRKKRTNAPPLPEQRTPEQLQRCANQTDEDAQWTKKHQRSYFGYKNHVAVDVKYKLIREYVVSTAEVHDSQRLEEVLGPIAGKNSSRDVYADSAYSGAPQLDWLKKKKYRLRVCAKGVRGHPLTEREKQANRNKSKVRARCEHVFGMMVTMGSEVLRSVGLKRTEWTIGARNLLYNMRRYCYLVRAV